MNQENDWQSVVGLGIAVIIVGLLMFVFSGVNFQWLAEHRYIANAPASGLIAFIIIGSVLIFGGSRWRDKIHKDLPYAVSIV